VSGGGERRVVVVGGGLAGMAAALACADRGTRVTLLEARPRLGGATFSFRRHGMWVDNGQHVFLRCCTAYRGFLRRVGAEGRTSLQPRMAIPVLSPGGRRGWLRRSRLPAPLHLAGSLATYPFLRPAERARAGMAALALGRIEPSSDLDRRTFGAWLRERRQSPAAIDRLWNLIALPTLNLSADEASLALAVKVFRTGLLDAADAGDVGYATVPLSELHAEPAAAALAAAGAAVRTRAAVRAIEVDPTGGFGVRVDGQRLDADAVVVAVPHEEAALLLPAGALADPAALRGLGRSPIVNVHVVYDRPVMDLPFAAGVGTPVQWVFDRTRQAGLAPGGDQYLAVSLSGAASEIEERTGDLRRRFLSALEALFPAARGATVRSFFVTREPAATFRQAPGTAALRPGPQTAVAGLSLAGAWTDTGWPATMEGAVRSGLAAASVVLRSLELRPRAHVPAEPEQAVPA
jgi:squalene-associated FAD-dependent desaturase